MPDIIETVSNATVGKKVRSPKITIINPFLRNKSVRMETERIPLDSDGKQNGKGDTLPPVIRIVGVDGSGVAAETFMINDPVTGAEVTISGAGIASAIETAFVRWYGEDVASRAAAKSSKTEDPFNLEGEDTPPPDTEGQ